MVNPRVIAIIPARGGSKRIKNKNIVDFCGKPMIAWTIEAAFASGVFEEVIVSTDDENIANVAINYGAQVPFMRKEHVDDHSPVSLATVDALVEMQKLSGISYDVVVQLMANCPLRGENDIKAAIDAFFSSQASSQISCFRYGWMNPWWAVELDSQGSPKPLFPHAIKSRSQDLPELYCPTGAIWISKVRNILSEKTFYSDGYRMFPMEWTSSVDIDELSDLLFAETIYLQKHKISVG